MSMLTMGLNQDTLDSLHQTDAITQPNEMNAGSGATIIINTDTESTDKLGHEVIENFDDFEIILTTQKDLESDRIRLEDVAQTVMASESISYSDVQLLLKSIDLNTSPDESEKIVTAGIAARLDEKVPLDSYTENPSTINLAETKKFFKKELNLNYDAFAKTYADFLTNKADLFIDRANALIGSLEKEIECQNAWASKCMNYLQASRVSGNYLAYLVTETGEPGKRHRDSKLHDIRHIPLDCYRHEDIVEYGFGVPSGLFSSLGHFFQHEHGRAFVKTIKRTLNNDLSNTSPYYRTVLELLHPLGESRDESDIGCSYHELLTFFAGGETVAKLEQMKLYLEHEVVRIQAMKEACLKNTPCVVDGKEWRFHEAVNHIVGIISAFSETFQFLTLAETSRDLSAPVFEVMNAVLTA